MCSSGWTDVPVPDGLSPAGNGNVENVPLKYLTKLFKNITFRKNPADIDIYGPPNYKCPRFHFSNLVMRSFLIMPDEWTDRNIIYYIIYSSSDVLMTNVHDLCYAGIHEKKRNNNNNKYITFISLQYHRDLQCRPAGLQRKTIFFVLTFYQCYLSICNFLTRRYQNIRIYNLNLMSWQTLKISTKASMQFDIKHSKPPCG